MRLHNTAGASEKRDRYIGHAENSGVDKFTSRETEFSVGKIKAIIFWQWLAGTNCIFIWLEARDEGGMRGPSSLNLPTLLGRPVWRAYLPLDHIGLEGKRLQLQPRSPLGVVWSGEASKPDWALSWACLNLVYPDWHFTRCQREDTGTLICVLTWPGVLTPLNKTWSYYYILLLHTQLHMSLLFIIIIIIIQTMLGTPCRFRSFN